MTSAATADDPYLAMLRGPLLPTAVAALATVAVCWWLQGSEGLLGAALGAVVTVAFFATSLLVMSRTARAAPHHVMAVALLTYVTKIGALGLLLVLLMDAAWLSGEAFAAGALVSVAVWLPLEVRAYSRARLFVLEPVPRSADGPPP